MTVNCVIVDDEPLARQGLTRYVHELDFLNLVGACEHPLQLTTLLDKNQVDLIFLDIQMPKMTGIDFLKMSASRPLVIITTAFPGFALEGFQLDVLDYLVKPITFDRFFKAAAKARDYKKLLHPDVDTTSRERPSNDYFFIKCDGKFEKISYNEILYVEGMQNYVVIHTDKRKYATLLTMKHLEENLKHLPFLRVHKSFLVAANKIDSIESHELVVKGSRIPLSRNHREQVMEKVLSSKLLDRKK